MNFLKKILILLLTIVPFLLKGQDPSFSQFYFNQLYFNPAFCGISRGLNTSFTHRILWPGIPGKFNTSKFSADMDMSSSLTNFGGLGLMVINDIEGDGQLKTLTMQIPFSIRIQLHEKHTLQFAIPTSIIRKSINWNNFTFSDQYDEVHGKIYSTDFYYPDGTSTTVRDFSAGVLYEFINAPYKRTTIKRSSLRAGGALHHLFKPEFSFLNSSGRLPWKIVLHINGEMPLINNDELIIAPAFVFEKQKNRWFKEQKSLNTFYTGSNAIWRNFFIGTWARFGNHNSDAIIITSGVKFGESAKSYIYYARDLTISKLMAGTGGSHEISISYILDEDFLNFIGIKKKKKTRVKKIYCPEF